ncbi:MAG: nucleoside hydrolase [Clostridiales bacterium]|jgi:inosine-uridine nucleoside N-ribohydrolase|nr:nucleoside hydrolase [Clostridiales bacterium]
MRASGYKKIIIDTDLGDDIDDIFALAFAFASRAFEVGLISVCWGDIDYKLKTAARLLAETGVSAPFARGRQIAGSNTPHDVSGYAAPDCGNAADGIARAVGEGARAVVSIGPLTNIADFVSRYPALKNACRIVWMGGSLRRGYIGQTGPTNEFNAAMDPVSAAAVMRSGFDVALAPLDVCRDFIVDGERFARIRRDGNPFARAALNFYAEWHRNYRGGALKYPERESSGILYDLVPFLYLLRGEWFGVETMRVACDGKGFTRETPDGATVKVLTSFPGKERALDFVADVFTRRSN